MVAIQLDAVPPAGKFHADKTFLVTLQNTFDEFLPIAHLFFEALLPCAALLPFLGNGLYHLLVEKEFHFRFGPVVLLLLLLQALRKRKPRVVW